MTAYSSLVGALEGYLGAAGATMSSPAVAGTVVAGEPPTIDRPTIAYWFLGIKPWETNTLGATQEMWGFHIRAYYPLGQRGTPPRSQVEAWIAGITSAIRAQLYGHVKAGNYATGSGIELSDAEAGTDNVSGVECRVVDMEWWAQMSNVATIA